MKIGNKRYKLKKEVKNALIYTILIILFILTIILLINKLKDDFKKCDEKMGYTCTLYDLHNSKNK